jgi:altronate dehydratase
MDVNAGAYLDGAPMDELGVQTFDLTCRVASGQRSVGENAGHTQAQIWRNWPQTDTSNLDKLLHTPQPVGANIPIQDDVIVPAIQLKLLRTNGGHASDQIGLILPTSLCASQVAGMAAFRLNKKGIGRSHKLSRFVALAHTEGCGNNAGPSEEMHTRTLLGYVAHPLVKHCLLMEHGCEKTHNDHYRHAAQEQGLDLQALGWASIQLDGGIDKVMDKVEAWFSQVLSNDDLPVEEIVGLEALRLGLLSAGPVPAHFAAEIARLTKMVVKAGGAVVMPENTSLLSTPSYRDSVLRQPTVLPTLGYGEPMHMSGFHVMETPTEHWVETLTGLAATGVEIILAHIGEQPMQGHPLVPVVQVTSNPLVPAAFVADLDLVLAGEADSWNNQILSLLVSTLQREYTPRLYQQGNIDFQLTRGFLGVTL